MQIGKNSHFIVLKIGNTPVKIQANKNYGICDMYPRINDVLSSFQGCQVNDPAVIENLENVLSSILTA
jgi:hypothetical protein